MADACNISGKDTSWRFIDDGEHSGAMNMARDEAIGMSTGPGLPPTLRVYRFKPAAVSIGRFQPVSGFIDLEACKRENIDIVRRPTGGLAILHKDEFTYSLSLPGRLSEPAERDQCFELVGKGILGALLQLGITGRLVSHRGKGIKPSVWCFDATRGVDIEWQGRKICGSAQRMFKGAVMQHGSLFLRVRPYLLDSIALGGDRDANKVQRGSVFVSLSEAAGRTVTWEQVSKAFREGFSESLSLAIQPGILSKREELLAESLYETKYTMNDWNLGTG